MNMQSMVTIEAPELCCSTSKSFLSDSGHSKSKLCASWVTCIPEMKTLKSRMGLEAKSASTPTNEGEG